MTLRPEIRVVDGNGAEVRDLECELSCLFPPSFF
jgi:hypothetical protein